MSLVKKIFTIAALLGSGTAHAGVPAWTVSETSGAVQVSRPGLQTVAASRGGALRAGDIVSTGKGGRAVLVRGEEYLVVSPGTRLTIADPKPGSMTQVIQSLGNTLYKIKKMATPHFAVETPYLAAVVKGTTFSVTVTPNGASVQVTEGRVQVATPDGGASYMVTPGVIGLVNRNAPYRLTVQGRETTVIDSPNAPAGAAAPAPEVETSETKVALEAGIEHGIGEGPVQLSSLSGGLIGGDSALAAATTSARVQAQRADLFDLPPAGGGSVDPSDLPPSGGGSIETVESLPPVAGGGDMGSGVQTADDTQGNSGNAGGGTSGAVTTPGAASAGSATVEAGGGASGVGAGAGVTVGAETSGDASVAAGTGATVGGGASAGVGAGVQVGGNGNGNNGNGRGNGGGNGSNAGGNGNGNAWGFGHWRGNNGNNGNGRGGS